MELQGAGRRAEPSQGVYLREKLPVNEEEWLPQTSNLLETGSPPASMTETENTGGRGRGGIPVATSLNREEKASLGSLLQPSTHQVQASTQGKKKSGRDTSKLDPSVVEVDFSSLLPPGLAPFPTLSPCLLPFVRC